MHETFMRRCFELAREGVGRVSPNPLVGAVLVKDGRIIGEGRHLGPGLPHAEPDCFARASEDSTGATLYVNLEPCCHTRKRTPPCAPFVIQKKIARLVVSNLDPNPSVAGLGLQQIKAAGIEVIQGVLESEGERLNEVFFHRMRTGLPFVHLKAAATLDGKIALPDGTSKWITGAQAREDGHRGRLGCDAIMIGAETLRKDDPSLTVRLPNFTVSRPPWRIVLSASGKLPPKAKLFTDELKERTLVVTSEKTQVSVLPEAQIIRLSTLEAFPFNELYQRLSEREIHSLWLEGGSGLHSLFLGAKQVHRLTLYLAPALMGAGLPLFNHPTPSLALMLRLESLETSLLGKDLKLTAAIEAFSIRS